MAKIGLTISVSGLTGKLIIRWLKASAPLAEVGRSPAFDFPYDAVYDIIDLDPVVYTVQLWRSNAGVTLDEIIRQWDIDASIVNGVTSTTYQYQVDRGDADGSTLDEEWADPADLDTTLFDQRLIGYDQSKLYVVEAGYGPLLNSEYTKRSPDDDGIDLLGGRTFNSGTAWFITVSNLVGQSAPPSSVGSSSQYAGIELVTASRNFYIDASNNLYNKLALINGAGTVLTITVGLISTIPDGTRVTFNTHNGNQNYLALQLSGSDFIRFCGETKFLIHIARNEEVSLFFFGGSVYISAYNGNAKIRGSIVGDYKDRSGTGSFILAATVTGILTKATHPGLYAFVESLPPGVAVTTHAAWLLDKTRYYINTSTEEFRVPDLANMHRRFKAATEVSGTYEADNVKAHGHELRTTNGLPSPNNTADPVRGTLAGTPATTRGVAATPPTDNKSIGLTGGTENTVKSFKEIPMVVL